MKATLPLLLACLACLLTSCGTPEINRDDSPEDEDDHPAFSRDAALTPSPGTPSARALFSWKARTGRLPLHHAVASSAG